ncbi:hypothetical protein CKO28_25965, partial [Rhodovibrio sodomensis]
ATSDDNTYEGNEALRLDLSGVQHASLARTSATGTILEDDPKPNLRVRDYGNVTENNTSITFTIDIDRRAEGGVCFNLWTTNDSAESNDYNGVSATRRCIGENATSRGFNVGINEDGSYEGNDTFYLNAGSPSVNLNIADSRGYARIVNDDSQYSSCGSRAVSWLGSSYTTCYGEKNRRRCITDRYECSARVQDTGHNGERVVYDTHNYWRGGVGGSARFRCNDGRWEYRSGSCTYRSGNK